MRSPSTLLIAALAAVLLGSADAADFKVADFGALGGGQNDDAPAVRKALAAAIEAGPGSRLVFEKKVYRFARQPDDAILPLKSSPFPAKPSWQVPASASSTKPTSQSPPITTMTTMNRRKAINPLQPRPTGLRQPNPEKAIS